MPPLSFDNGWTDRNADSCTNTVDEKIPAAKNSVIFGPVTPKILRRGDGRQSKLRRHGAAMPEGPKFEARGAEPGVEFLGKGQLSPLPTSYTVWESGVNSFSGIQGKTPAEIDFCVFLIPQKASSRTILVSKSINFDGKNFGEVSGP